MNNGLNGLNPLAYQGVNPINPVPFFSRSSSPTSTDVANFILGTVWLNTATQQVYILTSQAQGQANWQELTSAGEGSVTSLTGDTGTALPDSGNIQIAGDGTNISTAGSGSTVTVTLADSISVSGSITAGTDLTATAGNISAPAGNLTIGGNVQFTSFGSGVVRSDGSGNITSSASLSLFTPTLTFGGGSTGITYGTQAGGYFVLGPIVYVYFSIVLTSKGSSTGTASVTGLDLVYPSATGSIATTVDNMTLTGTTSPVGFFLNGGLSLNVGSAGSFTLLDDTAFTDTTAISVSGTILHL